MYHLQLRKESGSWDETRHMGTETVAHMIAEEWPVINLRRTYTLLNGLTSEVMREVHETDENSLVVARVIWRPHDRLLDLNLAREEK